MANQKLIDSIKSRLSQGTPLNLIRRQLFLQGTPPKEIEEAIKSLNSKKENKRFSLSLKQLMIILGATILIIVVLFTIIYFLKSSSGNSQPTTSDIINSIKIKEISKLIQDKPDLTFSYELSSDSSEEIEVVLKKEILDSKNTVMSFLTEEETLSLTPEEEIEDSMDITSLPDGRYTLRLSLTYNKKTFKTTELFRILNTGPIAPINDTQNPINDSLPINQSCQQNACNDNNSCTTDRCENSVCIFEEITPCCGNSVCESSESTSSCPQDCQQITLSPDKTDADLIEEAESKVRSNPSQASQICSSLRTPNNKDSCFASLASISEKSTFCAQISDLDLKDDCYLLLATSSNNLCPKIMDSIKKATCESLP